MHADFPASGPRKTENRPGNRPGMTMLVILIGLLIMLHWWQTRVADIELRRQAQLAAIGVQVERLRTATETAPEEAGRVAREVQSTYLSLCLADPEAAAVWNKHQMGESITRLVASGSAEPTLEELRETSSRLSRQIDRSLYDDSQQSRLRQSRWAWLEGFLLLWLGAMALYQSMRKRGPNPTAVLERQLDQLEDAGRDLLRRFHEVDRSHRQLKADLSAAGRVQRALLPQTAPRLNEAEVGWMFTACSHVAGDMFNVFALDDEHLGVWVLDVSGHGVPAALLSVSVSRVLHPNSRQGGLLRRAKLGAPGASELVAPAQVARELNRRFPQSNVAGLYFTLLYGILDTARGAFTYVRCGHPAPIRVESQASRVYEVESDGCLPVGIFENCEFHDEMVQLSPGDRLVLYTDGITECSSLEGDFGEGRLLEVLGRQKSHDSSALMESLKAELALHASGQRQRDDQTAVCITWRPHRA